VLTQPKNRSFCGPSITKKRSERLHAPSLRVCSHSSRLQNADLFYRKIFVNTKK
jgi:hypothetical protein